MTKEALQEQHRMIIGLHNGSSEYATKLSIQYAIEVLEELSDKWKETYPDMATILQSKIITLKSLLK